MSESSEWAPTENKALEVANTLAGIPNIAEAARPNPRVRQVWTKDKWKRLNRCSDLLEAEGVKMKLRCTLGQCPDQVIRIVPDASVPMGAILRCGCTDRIFARF